MSDAESVPVRGVELGGACSQVVTSGKNLLDMVTLLANSTYADDGGVFSIASPTPIPYKNPYVFSDEPVDCVMSCIVKNGTSYNARVEIGVVSDGVFTNLGHISESSTAKTVKVKANAVRLNWTTEGSFEIGTPQVELGSTATAWEPYTGGKPSPSPDYPQEPRFTTVRALDFSGTRVDLPEPVVLRALPDGTRDALRVGRDGVGVVRRVASARVEGVGHYGSSAHSFMCQAARGRRPAADSRPGCAFLLCDSMQVGYAAWTDGDGSPMLSTTSSPYDSYVYVRIPEAGTDAEANAWLAAHPVVVWYALATPAAEQLPAPTLPPVCAEAGPATVAAVCDGPAPSIEVEYVRSLPLVVGRLAAAVTA